jgi:phosphoserine/homoserine phosphotransferase
MTLQQSIVVLDLEGVLVPEIWIAFAEKTNIPELRLTTRDIPNYDDLMQGRLRILQSHNLLRVEAIQEVINTLSPLPGALQFMQELRTLTQVIILSDTFQEFAGPLMRQLEYPSIFCHNLIVQSGIIKGYQLRQPDQKKKSVEALKSLNFRILAAGDSFNDTTMLIAADQGIFFKAPASIQAQFPQFPAVDIHSNLLDLIKIWLRTGSL